MTNEDVVKKLALLDKDRAWLAEYSGYSKANVNNALGPSGNISKRMMAAFERAILEEERRRNIDITKPGASVWDLVMFTGKEVTEINEARRIGGYEKIEDLYNDAVIAFAKDLIAKEEADGKTPETKEDQEDDEEENQEPLPRRAHEQEAGTVSDEEIMEELDAVIARLDADKSRKEQEQEQEDASLSS